MRGGGTQPWRGWEVRGAVAAKGSLRRTRERLGTFRRTGASV